MLWRPSEESALRRREHLFSAESTLTGQIQGWFLETCGSSLVVFIVSAKLGVVVRGEGGREVWRSHPEERESGRTRIEAAGQH